MAADLVSIAATWRKARLMALLALVSALCAVPVPGAADETQLQGRGILDEINLARRKPLQYASYLEQFREMFQGNTFRVAGTSTVIRTEEGVAAVDEAIRFLRQRKPVPPLTWSPGLTNAAAELADEQGENGATGHEGGASGSMRQRIERRGAWRGAIGENIAYGPADARDVVIQLIVDDGVPDRGHRKNLFSRYFTTVGVSCGTHPRFETVCVMDFAGGFR